MLYRENRVCSVELIGVTTYERGRVAFGVCLEDRMKAGAKYKLLRREWLYFLVKSVHLVVVVVVDDDDDDEEGDWNT